MNIQTAFVYCFLTIVIVYIFLYLENRYLSDDILKNNTSNRNLRISILCGLLIWIIIVYFIYQIETTIPTIASNGQLIIQDKF